MPALITDKLSHASQANARPEPTSLTATKNIGDPSITTVALTGWNTGDAVHFQIYKTQLDNTGKFVITPGTQTDWKGIVNGSQLTQLQLKGGVDQEYPAGSIVIALATAGWANDLIDALQVGHNQDGTQKPFSESNIVTAASIQQNAVKAEKLATDAITLGYAQLTANFSTPNTTAVTAVPALSAAVTVPAGGRRLKITAYAPTMYSSTVANAKIVLTIWDGAVGTGTQIGAGNGFGGGGAGATPGLAMACPTPSAGAKTYNVGITHATGSGVATIESGGNYPAFLLVEAI